VIATCREYLEQLLKNAGIARVFTRPEDAAKHQAVPYAMVALDTETMQYDGSLVARADGPGMGERTFRRRVHRRSVRAKVKIVHRDQAAADTAGTVFLAGLARRILDPDGNAILVSARGAEPEEETSLLRQQAAAYFEVLFEGGVYADKTVKIYPLETALAVEGEIVEEV
jgi:hypothetical protein